MSPSARAVAETADRVLIDVNALAIALVDDHPGYEYVRPELESGLDGMFDVVVFDYHPLRAQYVMTTDFAVERVAARNSIQSLLRQPVQIVGASRETLLEAYEISARKNHDVYDSFLIALAREHDIDGLLTTDTDFESLCAAESLTYVNPVPRSVLEQFNSVAG